MNLETEYLGLKLKNPIMPGASPLVDDLATVRRLEDAGAAAIVMHSLFEEQIELERGALDRDVASHTESFAEALTYLPNEDDFDETSDQYLQLIGKIKASVSIPVIASLNGITPGGWIGHAKLIAGVTDILEQERLANLVMLRALTVRALEKAIADGPDPAAQQPEPTGAQAHLKDLEKTITRQLGLRVSLRAAAKKGKGKLIIHYASLDQFDELLSRLGCTTEV